jgi:hypothetical protein
MGPGATTALAWSPWRTFGIDQITLVTENGGRFAPTALPSPGLKSLPSLPLNPVRQFLVTMVTNLLPTCVTRVLARWLFPSTTIDESFMLKLCQILAPRRLTTYTFMTLMRTAMQTMETQFPLMLRRYPHEMTKFVYSHVSAAWVYAVLEGGALYAGSSALRAPTYTANVNLDSVAEEVPLRDTLVSLMKLATVSVVLWHLLPFTRAFIAGLFSAILRRFVLKQLNWTSTYAIRLAQWLRPAAMTLESFVKALFSKITPEISSLARNGWSTILTGVQFGLAVMINFLWHIFKRMPQMNFTTSLHKVILNSLRATSQAREGVVAAVFEESIAEWLPWGDVLIVGAELCVNGPVNALMLASFRPLSFAYRLAIHAGWNLGVGLFSESQSLRWLQFCAQTHGADLVDADWDYDVKRVTQFAPHHSLVPRYARSNISPKPQCKRLRFFYDASALEDVAVRGDPTLYFMPTNVPLYAVSNNGSNFYSAITTRITAEHPNPQGQARVFSQLPLFIPDQESPLSWTPALLQDYINHFPPKKAAEMTRIAELFQLNKHQPLEGPHRYTKIFLKSDEVLVKPSFDVRARVIANVHPHVQVMCGPIVRVLTARLHQQWDGDRVVTTVLGLPVRILFSSGVADTLIGRMLDDALAFRGIWIIVGGDDGAVLVNDGSSVIFCDSDMTAFDQSQDSPCLEYAYRSYERLGMLPEHVDWLRATSKLPYMAETPAGARFVIIRKNRAMRDTGGPDTTLGNSIINASAWLYALRNLDPLTWDSSFREAGFQPKIHLRRSWQDMCFLKGKWYTTRSGTHVWGPNPSRFLKLGKMITSSNVAHRQLFEACLSFARDLSATYAQYSRVPLISAWIKKFPPSNTTAHLSIEWMIKGSAEQLNNAYYEASLYYGVDPAWFTEVENLLRDAPLFSFLEHPLFRVMALRDY